MYYLTASHVREVIHTSSVTTELIVTFLKMWREYANGHNGVSVPRGGFTVSIRPSAGSETISVIVTETPHDYFPTPTYYDDPREFGYTKQWTLNDIPWVSTHTVRSRIKGPDGYVPWATGQYTQVNIPLSLLCNSKARQCIEVIAQAIEHDNAQKIRREAILKLQTELDAIKAGGPIPPMVVIDSLGLSK